MIQKTQTEIIELIKQEKTLTAVEIIQNHKNLNECSIIINDELFSTPYETQYTEELVTAIKEAISEDILLLKFTDAELPEAWKQSFKKAGILERYPDDRRLKFHAYNEMNEQFCIDRNLLWNITDEFKGTPHELTEEKGSWMYYMTLWYREQLI